MQYNIFSLNPKLICYLLNIQTHEGENGPFCADTNLKYKEQPHLVNFRNAYDAHQCSGLHRTG